MLRKTVRITVMGVSLGLTVRVVHLKLVTELVQGAISRCRRRLMVN